MNGRRDMHRVRQMLAKRKLRQRRFVFMAQGFNRHARRSANVQLRRDIAKLGTDAIKYLRAVLSYPVMTPYVKPKKEAQA